MTHHFARFWRLAALLFFLSLPLGACQGTQLTSSQPEATPSVVLSPGAPSASNPAPSGVAATGLACSSQPTAQYAATLPCLNGKATIDMTVGGGSIVIEVEGSEAPITAGNFVDLVNKGFYNGLSFHRVVKDPTPFVVQGGDPNGNGTGSYTDPAISQTRYIPLEIRPAGPETGSDSPVVYGQVLNPSSGPGPALRHTRGAVAMARSQEPNSASCQFYFALDDLSFLDGGYAVFGYVTQGMEVVDRIQQGDKIESVQVVSGLDNLQMPGGSGTTSASP